MERDIRKESYRNKERESLRQRKIERVIVNMCVYFCAFAKKNSFLQAIKRSKREFVCKTFVAKNVFKKISDKDRAVMNIRRSLLSQTGGNPIKIIKS